MRPVRVCSIVNGGLGTRPCAAILCPMADERSSVHLRQNMRSTWVAPCHPLKVKPRTQGLRGCAQPRAEPPARAGSESRRPADHLGGQRLPVGGPGRGRNSRGGIPRIPPRTVPAAPGRPRSPHVRDVRSCRSRAGVVLDRQTSGRNVVVDRRPTCRSTKSDGTSASGGDVPPPLPPDSEAPDPDVPGPGCRPRPVMLLRPTSPQRVEMAVGGHPLPTTSRAVPGSCRQWVSHDDTLQRLANILPTYGRLVASCWVPVGVGCGAYHQVVGFAGFLQGRCRGFESLRAHRCSLWSAGIGFAPSTHSGAPWSVVDLGRIAGFVRGEAASPTSLRAGRRRSRRARSRRSARCSWALSGPPRPVRPMRSTVVRGCEMQDCLGDRRGVEGEGEMPLPRKPVELSLGQQFGNFVRGRED
jgi:hypothetical protein